jgi:serine/threonine-protein kinase RsbW
VTPGNEATLRVLDGELVGPLLSRVVGMLAARADCPVDRLDDALLICDTVAAHAPLHSSDGWTNVRVVTDDGSIGLHVGPLMDGGAGSLLDAAVLPGVGNVFQRVADEVTVSDDEIVIRLEFRT